MSLFINNDWAARFYWNFKADFCGNLINVKVVELVSNLIVA